MVHESEQFVVRDTIAVDFKRAIFKSCALMSKTQALVFTMNKVILVWIDKQIQKVLKYPTGVGYAFLSLNLMKIEPKIFIVAELERMS